MPPPPSRTRNKDGELPLLDLFSVMAIERNPPKGCDASCWVLLTDLPITTLDKAIEIIQWYVLRWNTVGEVYIWIAKLGGYTGRRTDPPPGMISLWRGWQRLLDMVEDYRDICR
jgi:hypothetical protein